MYLLSESLLQWPIFTLTKVASTLECTFSESPPQKPMLTLTKITAYILINAKIYLQWKSATQTTLWLTYHCEVLLPLLGVERRLALGDLAHVAAGGVQGYVLQHQLVHAHLQQLKGKRDSIIFNVLTVILAWRKNVDAKWCWVECTDEHYAC